MTIWSDELLSALEKVSAGVSIEPVEQLDCFIFQNGEVSTYDGEVLCRTKTPLAITGALLAAPLLKTLRMLGRRKFIVGESRQRVEENTSFETVGYFDREFVDFKNPSVEIAFQKEHDGEILLRDEVQAPSGAWKRWPAEIWEAVDLALSYFPQSDRPVEFRFSGNTVFAWSPSDASERFRCVIGTNFKRTLSLPGRVLKKLARLRMGQFSFAKGWIHFRDKSGLTVSCRYSESSMPRLNEFKGYLLRFTEDARKLVEAARSVAPKSELRVALRKNILQVKAESLRATYAETVKVRYSGPSVEFLIPSLKLAQIFDDNTEVVISPELLRLKAVGVDWDYALQLSASTIT